MNLTLFGCFVPCMFVFASASLLFPPCKELQHFIDWMLQVPVSSLKDKVIGLYFCENIPHPTDMKLIKEVYEEAKSSGYDFEIVQINFHYHCFRTRHQAIDPTVDPCRENISWLTLPFKDPRCRKLQHLLRCETEGPFASDQLVIVDPRQADSTGVLFEYSGAKIFQVFGAEGYPFTRQSLFETEYRRNEQELRLQSLFSPEECLLRNCSGDHVHGSQLLGKRVLVLFGELDVSDPWVKFISMLETAYRAQHEEDEFEVVYVSTDKDESSFTKYMKDMPWLVRPYSRDFAQELVSKVFRAHISGLRGGAAAFDKNGQLIAKDGHLSVDLGTQTYTHRFPFVSRDLKDRIRQEVKRTCRLDWYLEYE